MIRSNFTKKERHGKRVNTFDSPHILAHLELDIKNFSTKLQYFVKFTRLKFTHPTNYWINCGMFIGENQWLSH